MAWVFHSASIDPNTSYLIQPLDVGCFAPLKAIYNVEYRTYMRLNPDTRSHTMLLVSLPVKRTEGFVSW